SLSITQRNRRHFAVVDRNYVLISGRSVHRAHRIPRIGYREILAPLGFSRLQPAGSALLPSLLFMHEERRDESPNS
ncbi:MAG TPA: hypothetical protein VE957_03400, partial [Terriglobales bacterium]|nr:hypothetical protein [Terriglobales bacterium]